MRPIRISHKASLLVALCLATASVAVSAANLKPGRQEHSFPGIIHARMGPVLSLIDTGQESWLGLIVKDTNEATAKELKLPHVTGVLVVSVIPGSPAAKADFKPNDVILEFAGRRVGSVAQLHRLIEETPAGRTVSVRISRHGKLQTL